MAFVTFVIPSIGRESLDRTVDSLLNQTDGDWNAVIYFDGVDKRSFDDDRIETFQGKATGNCGLARNKAIARATGEWTAFVDDDDFLANTYVGQLKQYGNGFDIVQFTFRIMERGDRPDALKPAPHINKITAGEMGISFAVRTAFRTKHDIWFKPGIYDDYRFLAECEAAGARINVTHDVQYIVPKIGRQGVLRMFDYMKQYRAIIVTGPQRSGTRITAKMIARDTGHKFIDEQDINIDSLYRFIEVLDKSNIVIHCPALSSYVHAFGHYEDIAVVMVHRPLKDIEESQKRINWPEYAKDIELFRYGKTEGNVAEVKYTAWKEQKQHILNAIDVNYENLSSHPLWIPKNERKGFSPQQTAKEYASLHLY